LRGQRALGQGQISLKANRFWG